MASRSGGSMSSKNDLILSPSRPEGARSGGDRVHQWRCAGGEVEEEEEVRPQARCDPLPLWERVASEASRVRGSSSLRKTPHPAPRRDPLPQGERVFERGAPPRPY